MDDLERVPEMPRRRALIAGSLAAGVSALAAPALASAADFTVDSATDGPGTAADCAPTPVAGSCSLRDAVAAANAAANVGGNDQILFASSLSGATIDLTAGQITVSAGQPLNIDASALAEQPTIDANESSRILELAGTGGTNEITGLRLTGGRVDAGGATGGGVYAVASDLTITESTLTGNSATTTNATASKGGAVGGRLSSVRLVGSTLSGNTADTGGAVYAYGSSYSSPSLTLIDSTVSGNGGGRAVVSGDSMGQLAVHSSTIAGNASGVLVSSNSSAPSFDNTIVADNGNDLLVLFSGPGAVVSDSLIENPADPPSGIDTAASSNYITGEDPQLGPLADNGGPTRTQLPAPTSPVVDAGVSGSTDTDQRGLDRPDDITAIADGPGSDGADMGAVELQQPDALIISGPQGGSTNDDPTPTFELGSDPVGAGFECSLDGAAFAACTSPLTTPRLDDGAHTLDVRAIFDGITGTTERADFTVDAAAPAAEITTKPAPRSRDTTPIIAFSSSDADLDFFECRLDSSAAADWARCTSPVKTPALGDGPHDFQVRAVDMAGNVGPRDAASFTVDTTGPIAQFAGAPPPTTSESTVRISFTSSAPDLASFECSLDGGAFESCVSPYTSPELTTGPHTFSVRAIDDLGNAGAAQQVAFTTTAEEPEPKPEPEPDREVTDPDVSLEKKVIVKGRQFKGKIGAGAQEDVTALAEGTLIYKPAKGKGKTRRRELQPVSKRIEGGERKILRLLFEGSAKQRAELTRKLKRTLARGRLKVRLRAQVTLSDDAGNSVTEKRVARLRPQRSARR